MLICLVCYHCSHKIHLEGFKKLTAVCGMGFYQFFKDGGKVSRIWCSATVLKLYTQFDLLKNPIEMV